MPSGAMCRDMLTLAVLTGSEAAVMSLPSASTWLPYVRVMTVETHDRFVPGCTTAVTVHSLLPIPQQLSWLAAPSIVMSAHDGTMVSMGVL